ncbi:MAG: ABC transporter substrate-binding protein [Pseudomonadales bacterium]
MSVKASSGQIKRVVVPLLDWPSQRVISKALVSVLPATHYQVRYRQMSEEKLWGAMARDRVDFQIEIWQASADEDFQVMLDKGRLIDLGTHAAITREDWWYPEHVAKLCPGLPDWRALNRCAELFSRDGSGLGAYLTGPWPYRDPDLIRSLQLKFKIVRHSDSDSIWQEMAQAVKDNRAIVLLNWTPNWTDQRFAGQFVEFPEYTPECETDPRWGINKTLAFDCGNVKRGWIKKAGSVNLPKDKPCLYQYLKNVNLSGEMIAYASVLVDYEKLSEEAASKAWLARYRTDVDQWYGASCLAG